MLLSFNSTLRRRAAIAASALVLLSVFVLAQPQAIAQQGSVPYLIENNIRDASAYYQLDPALLSAVMKAESGYNPWAVSRKGALGLMQLMPQTAWTLGVRNPFNPRENTFAGALYLKGLLDKYKDADLALAAYNAGSGAVDSHRGVPPYRETIRYINRIAYLYQSHRLDELKETAEAISHVTLGSHTPTQ